MTLDIISNLGKPYRDKGEVVKAEKIDGRTARVCADVETNHEAETVYPEEQILISEASYGTIDSHVGDLRCCRYMYLFSGH